MKLIDRVLRPAKASLQKSLVWLHSCAAPCAAGATMRAALDDFGQRLDLVVGLLALAGFMRWRRVRHAGRAHG